jgi:hypothetical protein
VGFGEQLDQQQAACEETGLVWVGDPKLDAWVGKRHRSLRAGKRVRMRTDKAWALGRQEGRTMRLHKALPAG